MKKLYLAAALVMASTAAHAGNSVSFEIDGQKVRIEVPRHCDSLSCIQIWAPGLAKPGFNLGGLKWNSSDDDDEVAANSTPPAQTTAPAPATKTPASQVKADPPTPSQAVAPAANNPAPATAAPATRQPAQPAAASAPAATPTTPVGVWSTEEDKGSVRIEQCGPNLCGYATGSGEKILIDMKPVDSKWTGRIHDPDSDRNYDSTIAMKGPNALKVEGCALGGLFCGGQIWKRVG